MSFNREKIRYAASAAFYALLVLAPFGTRYIFRLGEIGGVPVEWGAVSLFGTQLLALAFVVLAGAAAGAKKIGQAFHDPINLAAAGLALAALLSTLQADEISLSLLNAAWVVLGAAIFIAVRSHQPSVRSSLVALTGGAAIQAVVGAWQFFTQSAPAAKWFGLAEHVAGLPGTFVVETASGRWLRAYGTFGHPNLYGFYLALGLVAAIALVAAGRRQTADRVWLPILPILAAGLLFAFSRSAVLALAAGLAVFLFASCRRGATCPNRRGIVIAVVACLTAATVLTLIYPDPALTRASGQGRLELRSSQERVTGLGEAFELVAQSHALGVGIGQMPASLYDASADGRAGWDYQNVHDVPLLILVDLGIVGFLIWCVFVLLMLRIVWRAAFAAGAAPPAAVLAALLVVTLVVSLFDHFLWSQWPGQLLFWLVAASATLDEA